MLHKDIDNNEARYQLSYASMIMGINLSLSSTCLPHRIQYPIGAMTNTPHAIGLAAIYPAWLKHLESVTNIKTNQCNEWIQSHEDLSYYNKKKFSENIVSLINLIGMKYSLTDIGIYEKNIKNIANKVDGNLNLDPSYKSSHDIQDILINSLDT